MGSKESDLLASLLDVYSGLGKRGKPLTHEHTSLAGISVEFSSSYYDVSMVGKNIFLAIASGTKCIPVSGRNSRGFALHDGHGEILARRIMLRWLIDEIKSVYNGDESLVVCIQEGNKCVSLREGVCFNLIVTSPPCGDCAVLSDQSGEYSNKRHRTGAKVVKSPSEIPAATVVENYDSYQASGVVRRKPGRGEPTSSVSCSDKILKWNILGFQGCLLKSLMNESLYFSDITIAYVKDGQGQPSSFASHAVQRALWKRAFSDIPEGVSSYFSQTPPKIHAVIVSREIMHKHGLLQSETRSSSAGVSAMWWAKPSYEWNLRGNNTSSQIPKGDKNYCEIIVGKTGYKMGSPKVMPADDMHLAERFSSRFSRAAIRKQIEDVLRTKGIRFESELPYNDFKAALCPEYTDTWRKLKRPPLLFSKWIIKNAN